MSRKHHMGKTHRRAEAQGAAHGRPDALGTGGNQSRRFEDLGIYGLGDMAAMQGHTRPGSGYHTRMRSLDELLERDKQREADGFPRKIRIGKLIKPGKSGKDKVVVVPSTVEEKFIHDSRFLPQKEESSGGSGAGDEGEVIGEEPIDSQQGEGEGGAGGEGGGPHEMESSAYELGRILTEQFELPNLQEKGKRRSLTTYSYDLTDRNRSTGQFLDKKATLQRIVRTNIALGNLPDIADIEPSSFVVGPDDMIFRVLSREIDYESQAVVFFLRDYSGSMSGKPTDTVVSQHVMLYAWLLYQYSRQVETRFILHDTEAKEVPDFFTYYNYKVAGGTRIVSAYQLVTKIIEEESLYRDNNIYIFHGTDGDDWDKEGKETIPALSKMLTYANRVGITIARAGMMGANQSDYEKSLAASKILEKNPKLLRLDVIKQDADEARLIDGIKKLISE
jgi:uncharacterized sporulation protein YeaH/YhbH (DUF444 family)